MTPGTSEAPAERTPLRVMRIITRLSVSGPSTHAVLVNRGLERRGWKTMLVFGTPEPDEAEFDLAMVNVPMTRVPSLRRPPALRDAQAFWSLLMLMRRHRPTVVHTHHSKGGLLGRLAAAVAGVPVRIHTFHGTVFEGYFSPSMSRLIVMAERVMGRLTTQHIVLTDLQRDELMAARIGAPERIAVVPLGLELDRFADPDRATSRRALGIDPDAFVLVSVGRFAQIKRFDRLLRAFALATADAPSARLYLLGDGGLRRDLESLAAELGVAARVSFVGWADDVAAWYAAADAIVNSSDNEGTPLALIEAAASRRPAIATRVGGVSDVVDDGVTGLLVEREDLAGLARAIVRMASDAELRDRMGDAARDRSTRFGEERLVRDLDLLYRRLLLERLDPH